LFFDSCSYGLVMEMVCVACGACFFGHSQATWLGFPQYKQRLFVCWPYFSCSLRGLNLVLSIYMGLSFSKVVESWADIASEKLICVVDGVKLLCVVNVGSWCLFCQCLKSLLSHQITCAMVCFNVERSSKVNNKSFTSPPNPN
jgi:hypothetical protein